MTLEAVVAAIIAVSTVLGGAGFARWVVTQIDKAHERGDKMAAANNVFMMQLVAECREERAASARTQDAQNAAWLTRFDMQMQRSAEHYKGSQDVYHLLERFQQSCKEENGRLEHIEEYLKKIAGQAP